MGMICPDCQHSNREGAKFCENCGHALPVTCPNCGRSNRSGAKFCDDCGQRLDGGEQPPSGYQVPVGEQAPAEAPSSQPAIPASVPQEIVNKLEPSHPAQSVEGERRMVTVLFCDVKGSTEAAGQLDPEEWTEIMNGAFETMIQPVYHYEGTVANLLGDAVLAFFGAPVAHEDDPQRAVRAGLGIVEGISTYRAKIKQEWGIDFDVRVGINTGLLVVGAVGSDLHMEYTAMGDAINLAARMEQTAEPGTIRIAQDTYNLVAALFEFEDLGGVQVKGKSAPVHSYRVTGLKAVPGRQRGINGLQSPLIGRDSEKHSLEEAIANLGKGLGGIVYLLGEAGLGKSRLIQEVRRSLPDKPTVHWFETFSRSYETEHPYSLFRRLIRQVIGAKPEDGAQELRQKIRRSVEAVSEEERAPLQRVFEALFDLPRQALAGQGSEPSLEGETFKGLLYTLTASFWQHMAETAPVVLVCDDLHWSDPASLALLQQLYPLTDSAAILLVCSLRLEQDSPAWLSMQMAAREFPHRYSEMRLQPLNGAESGELVDNLLSISELPDDLRSRIMEKSEGNPYFVEEVIRTLIDRGVIVQDEDGVSWKGTADGADLDIPGNIQSLLIARMDRLAETTRRTLQVAAVVGRSFYFRVLQQIMDITGELEGQLLTLQQRQLILEATRLPEREYTFRHALTQEAAYSTILLKQRRAFHHAVGEALESLFPDRRDELAGSLAVHFMQGREFSKALHYFSAAGDAAFRLAAFGEALIHYEQAMEVAGRGGADESQLVHLYRRIGRSLELLMRHAEALENYQALEALGEARGDEALRMAGIAAQGALYYLGMMEREKSIARTEEALALARQLGDRTMEARCLWWLLVLFSWFDPPQAIADGEKALQIVNDLASRQEAAGDDLGLEALILLDLSLAHTNAGQMKLACERAQDARQMFEDAGNLPMLTTAIERIAFVHSAEGRLDQAVETFNQGMKIDQSIGNTGGVFSKYTNMVSQEIHPRLGDFSAFFAMLETGKSAQAEKDSVQEHYRNLFDELYPVVAFAYFGALDQVRRLLDPLLKFMDTGPPNFPPMLLSHAAVAFLRAGELSTGKDLLEKCLAHPRVENYILAMGANICQAQAELALLEGRYAEAVALVETFLEDSHAKGVRGYDPPRLLLKARGLLGAGSLEKAYLTYQEAHSLAVEQNARAVLWQICAELAELETDRGDLDEAQSLIGQARSAIEFIADHAGNEDLRSAFLTMPQVRSVLEKVNSKTNPGRFRI